MLRNHHVFAVLLTLGLSGSAWAQESAPPPQKPGWWSASYIIDYSLIAAGVTTYVVASGLKPRDHALFGPVYDPANPVAVLDPAHEPRIGRPFVENSGETVPVPHLVGIAAGLGAALAIQEGMLWAWSEQGSAQQFHEVLVGYAEAQALTAGATEFSKTFVGRLRPDFQDRAARHHCNTGPPPAGFDCTPYEGRPLDSDPERAKRLLEDGRKSFWSGHSSLAISTFMYATLVTGGRWVWGANATRVSRSLGLVAQMSFLGAATFIAGSRLEDGRHHVTDVLVGTAVGLGLANFAYWRRFDGEGRMMRAPSASKTTFRLQPGPGAGASLVVVH